MKQFLIGVAALLVTGGMTAYVDVDCNAYRSGEKKNDWSKVNTTDKAREADTARLRDIAAGNWTGTGANATNEVRSNVTDVAPAAAPANATAVSAEAGTAPAPGASAEEKGATTPEATVTAPAVANEGAVTPPPADSDSGRRLRRFVRDPENRELRRGGSRSRSSSRGGRSRGSGSGPSWGVGRRSRGSRSYYAEGGRYGRVAIVADGYAISQTYYGHYYGNMAEG